MDVSGPISAHAGRRRAQRLYPVIGPCQSCGAGPAERHHVDSNTGNNAPDNIRVLCRRCHMQEDGRLQSLAEMASRRAPDLIAAAATARRERTTCKRGHPLSGDNLYVKPSGSRVCKTCRTFLRLGA